MGADLLVWEGERPLHDPAIDRPPEGFFPTLDRGPFTGRNGPMYHGRIPGGARHGFRVRPYHCNSMGILHGGMASAFMDGVFGHVSAGATGHLSVTIRLTLDYLDSARVGDWLTGEGTLTGRDGDVLFLDGLARVDDRVILRAHGVFKMTGRALRQRRRDAQATP